MNDYEITGGCLLKYAGASPVAIIPSSVTVIARCAFNHSTVQTIYLPTTLKQIESDAFSECGSVNVVVKYNTDSDIESDINSSCRALLEYLEDNSGAETVTLVLNGEKAFDGCEFEEYHEAMLRVVELDISCGCVESGIFCDKPNISTVSIGAYSKVASDILGEATRLERVLIEEGHPDFASVNGVLFSADHKTLLRYPPFRKTPYYELPRETDTVAFGAFDNIFTLNYLKAPHAVVFEDFSIRNAFNLFYLSVDETVLFCRNSICNTPMLKIIASEGATEVIKYCHESGIHFIGTE